MSHDPNDPFDAQKEPYPFTEWDDLKFTVWGGFVLLLPVALIALAGWFVYSLFA